MSASRILFALACLVPGLASGAQPAICQIPGEAIQWQADFCLFKSETDDIIAAQPCMDRESARRHENSCAKKRHYKRALCALHIERGIRSGSIERCVDDARFSGKIVRNDGM